MANISILGAGGWGIAIAILLDNNGNHVTIWSAVDREVKMLSEQRENEISLKGIRISKDIQITADLEEAIKDKDIIVMAVASAYTRATAARLKGRLKDGQIMDVLKKDGEQKEFYQRILRNMGRI